MEGRKITLAQILTAREDRVKAQQTLLGQYRCPILSFTMNIAGPIKDSPLIRRSFREGIRLLEEVLPASAILAAQENHSDTGSTALYAVNMDAPALKEICVRIEEQSKLGRLFDMDVLDAQGKKLERGDSRGCIVCGAPGRNCAARRLHSVALLQEVTKDIMETYFTALDAETVADNAVASLLEEVNATPKPGLVDRRNNGSHTDMDLALFTASAHALKPYFRECFLLGTAGGDVFPKLRQAGLRAENAMLQATGGVNTHKGAIFTLGLLCGSIGLLWSPVSPTPPLDDVLSHCARLAAPAIRQDFANATGATAGERLYLAQGITGARGEAAAGFPSVRRALSFYRQQRSMGMDQNDALVRTLLQLIVHVNDTNLHHRGGLEGAQWAASAAKALLPCPTVAQLEALDDAFIANNLSPGGCADLLAAMVFLDRCCDCQVIESIRKRSIGYEQL